MHGKIVHITKTCLYIFRAFLELTSVIITCNIRNNIRNNICNIICNNYICL